MLSTPDGPRLIPRAPRKQRARLDTRLGGGHLLNHLYDLHILAQRHSVAGPSQSATRRQTQPPAPMSPQYRRCARRPSSSAYTLAGGEQRAVLSCPHRPDPIQVRESGSRTVPAVPHSERNGTAMYRRALCAVHGGCPKKHSTLTSSDSKRAASSKPERSGGLQRHTPRRSPWTVGTCAPYG